VYFNVSFNVFFKLIKAHLLVNELYIYQNLLKILLVLGGRKLSVDKAEFVDFPFTVLYVECQSM